MGHERWRFHYGGMKGSVRWAVPRRDLQPGPQERLARGVTSWKKCWTRSRSVDLDASPRGRSPSPEQADAPIVQARELGVELLDEGGLLQQMTKAVLERALAKETTDHPGDAGADILAFTNSPRTSPPRSCPATRGTAQP